MAYKDYANELMGYVPSFSFLLAQKAVNRAWRDIKESRLWSFLMLEGSIIVPNAITAGTVAVTQYSDQVTGSAAALAAWTGVQNPLITQRQFRVLTGPVYSIIAFDDVNGVLTLDKPYMGITQAVATYQIYQCYYEAPVADFLRWITVTDPTTPRNFKLRWDRAKVEKMDPQRTSMSFPYVLMPFKTNAATNVPIFEMWPHPLTSLGLLTMCQRRGTDFVLPTDALPPQIPEDLLMTRARMKAYQWAIANVGRYPELRGVSWVFVLQEAGKEFAGMLQKIHVQDEETFSQNFIVPDNSESYIGPIDANFMQSHGDWWS